MSEGRNGRNAGAIYGLMLVGWSIGGVVGPLIASTLIGSERRDGTAYTTLGVIALASTVLTFLTRIPRTRQRADEGHLAEVATGGPRMKG